MCQFRMRQHKQEVLTVSRGAAATEPGNEASEYTARLATIKG